MKLNSAQEKAVSLKDGPALVLAGPGSGKTAVITCRTHQLIRRFQIPAKNILVVTFSRKAAENMKSRFLSMHGGGALPFFGTFHSIFFMILKYAYGISAENIITDMQKADFLREEADRLGFEAENEDELFETLLNEISCIKSKSAAIEAFRSSAVPAKTFRALYSGYCRRLSESGLIDFDDMLSLCFTLLKERPDILSFWQERFRYILIDEFQDINSLQYETIRLLAAPENNLFAVGDDDQSIYGFRGARPDIMQKFLKDYPSAVRITLSRNYRCRMRIQNASVRVIAENRNRFRKELTCGLRSSSKGSFHIRRFADQEQEYLYLADRITELLSGGVSPKEIAVLVRSSLQLPLLLHVLRSRRIPVLSPFPEKDPFRSLIGDDIAAYLRLADAFYSRPEDPDRFQKDFFRIINRPSRYITRTALEQAFLSGAETSQEVLSFLSSFYRRNPGKRKALSKLSGDLRMLRKCTPYAAVKYLRSAMNYEASFAWLSERYRKSPSEYLLLLDEIEEALLEGAVFPQRAGSEEAAAENPRRALRSLSEEENCIRLMTMHAAKGLEFSFVFLPDLNEEIIPVKRAESILQIEEERRVFYVAMTRASDSLEILFSGKIRSKKAAPSRFLSCLLQ